MLRAAGTLIILLIAYGMVVGLAFISQRRLIYYPISGRPSENTAAARGLKYWPSYDGYRGFISATMGDSTRGTVIVFHGNAGAAHDRDYYIRALEPLGFRVILAEYPGYSNRPGKPNELSITDDARETVEFAYEEFGGPVYLWGESLGSGVAAALATGLSMPVRAVVLITPWDSLPNLSQRIYWYLPARWIVLDQFDNVKNLQSYRGRVAVLIADQDEVVHRQLGLNLHKSITADKKLWAFHGAGHNNWPNHPKASWWREVTEFMAAD
jgi:uncharacterized protein